MLANIPPPKSGGLGRTVARARASDSGDEEEVLQLGLIDSNRVEALKRIESNHRTKLLSPIIETDQITESNH